MLAKSEYEFKDDARRKDNQDGAKKYKDQPDGQDYVKKILS